MKTWLMQVGNVGKQDAFTGVALQQTAMPHDT